MKKVLFAAAIGWMSLAGLTKVDAQTNAFTYQGRLEVSNNAVTGRYDLRFGLCTDATSGGAWVQTTNLAVGVTNGLFTTLVNLGYVPTDATLQWLELGVRTNGGDSFVTVAPRQLLTPVYSAFFAYNASNAVTAASAGTVAATNITGTIGVGQLSSLLVTNGQGGVTINGTFLGNGGGLTNLSLAALQPAFVTAKGSGNFVSAGTLPAGSGSGSVAAADVNGDGLVDLISANANAGTLSVFTNNGQGSFTLANTIGSQLPAAVAAADVNGDGFVDLICANANANTLSVFTNNGQGSFALASTIPAGTFPVAVKAVDFNGDGAVDLIGTYLSSGTLSIWTNNGSGGFTLASTLKGGRVVTGDFNGDGAVDVIGFDTTVSSILVYTNDGHAGFAVASTLAVSPTVYPTLVAAADVNGDGAMDLISTYIAPVHGTLSIWTNNGHASLVLAGTNAVGGTPQFVATADLNGDGAVDLICANSGDNTLSVLTNNGHGNFALAGTLPVGAWPMCVATADINGDGTVDLISANSNGNSLSLLTNIPVVVKNLNLAGYSLTNVTAFGTYAGNGAALTDLSAASLTGTLPAAVLPANVVTNAETGVSLGGAFAGSLTGSVAATNGSTVTVGLGGTSFSHIEDGVFTAGANPGTNSLLVVTNAFSTVFNVAPMVLVSPVAADGSDSDDCFAVTVRRITTTNLVVNIHLMDSTNTAWTQNLRVSYHAWR